MAEIEQSRNGLCYSVGDTLVQPIDHREDGLRIAGTPHVLPPGERSVGLRMMNYSTLGYLQGHYRVKQIWNCGARWNRRRSE